MRRSTAEAVLRRMILIHYGNTMRKNTLVFAGLIGMLTLVTVVDPGYVNHWLAAARPAPLVRNVQPRLVEPVPD